MTQKIWFITGISSGLGKALAEAVMETGDFVIGTFRSELQATTFNNQHKGKSLGIILDITNHNDIDKACKIVTEKFKRVDVLVNNAGYGLAGAIEETSMAEAREIFEANFLAV
jgi:NADP-dependent 3-hydroxy acid dehydrogenase YdfG